MIKLLQPQIYPRTPSQTIALNGGAVTVDINRDSILAGLNIRVTGIVSVAPDLLCAEGAANVIKSITLSGTKNNGGNYTIVQGLSGADVHDFYQTKFKITPYIVNPTLQTGKFTCEIPLNFLEPTFGDLLSWATCVPAMLMNNLTLTIVPATQAELDVDATPAVAFSSLTFSVEQQQVDKNTLPIRNGGIAIPFLDCAFSTNTRFSGTDFSTSDKTQFLEPAGFLYTDLVYVSYASVSARQLDTTAIASAAPIGVDATQAIKLYDISRNVAQEANYDDMRARLHVRTVDTLRNGVIAYNFANDGRFALLDTTLNANTQGNLQLEFPTVTATGAKIRRISKTITDPANILGSTV